jgi:hypothetical protein
VELHPEILILGRLFSAIFFNEMIFGNPIRWTDPSAWPWFVYVWLAFIAAGWIKPLWRWIRRQQASSWPTTSGQIEYGSVEAKRFTGRRWNSPTHVSELGYSYFVAGSTDRGRFRREFGSEEEALEFVRDLKGKPIDVQYNPSRPSTSALLESSVDTLLHTRPPKPEPELEYLTYVAASYGPDWLKPFLWVFVGLSAVGLVLSLWVHLGAVAGRRVAPEEFFWMLHMGIFLVWFPAVLVAKERVRSLNRKDYWKVVLKGSPEWMRYMVYGFLGYAMINFTYFFFQVPTGKGEGANLPAIVWRGFSGHWMAFYSAALAILYSVAKANTTARRCSNGHAIAPDANFCARCGQPALHG